MTRSKDTVDPAVWRAKSLAELEAWLRDLGEINLTPTAAFRAALTAKRSEAARAFAATGIRMANESAFGIYTLTWTSPAGDGARVGVTWCEGMSGPEAMWSMPGEGRAPRHRPVANPARFGWPGSPPAPRQAFKALRAFAERYAVDLEASLAEDEPEGTYNSSQEASS